MVMKTLPPENVAASQNKTGPKDTDVVPQGSVKNALKSLGFEEASAKLAPGGGLVIWNAAALAFAAVTGSVVQAAR